MLDFLQTIDSQLLLALNSINTAFFDHFMSVATGRFVWVPFYLSIVVMFVARLGWRKAIVWVVAAGLCVALSDQLCATFIRPLVGRLRPSNELSDISGMIHIVNGYRGGPFGFPSCHGSNSFALATIVALVMRRPSVTCVMFFWALLNVYTRIYLGVHYPGDIIVGGIIGITISLTVYKAVRWIMAHDANFIGSESADNAAEAQIGHNGLRRYLVYSADSLFPVAVLFLSIAVIITLYF